MGKLTARKAATADPGKHEDGAGLRLVVSPAGRKKWVLRYTIDGRRREMGLGGFPDMSLAEARVLGRPSIASKPKPVSIPSRPTGIPATDPPSPPAPPGTSREHRRGWRNIHHARTWPRSLKTYAAPVIGAKPVDAISTDDVLAILTPIWNTKTETAKRLEGHMENVLDYAAAHGYRDQTNPACWRGHLDRLLPRPTKLNHYALKVHRLLLD